MWVRLSSAGRSPGEVCLLFAMVIIVTGVTHMVVERTADPLAEHGNGRESPTEFNATPGLPYARGTPYGRALPQPLLQAHRLGSASRRSEVISRQASSGPRAVKKLNAGTIQDRIAQAQSLYVFVVLLEVSEKGVT